MGQALGVPGLTLEFSSFFGYYHGIRFCTELKRNHISLMSCGIFSAFLAFARSCLDFSLARYASGLSG